MKSVGKISGVYIFWPARKITHSPLKFFPVFVDFLRLIKLHKGILTCVLSLFFLLFPHFLFPFSWSPLENNAWSLYLHRFPSLLLVTNIDEKESCSLSRYCTCIQGNIFRTLCTNIMHVFLWFLLWLLYSHNFFFDVLSISLTDICYQSIPFICFGNFYIGNESYKLTTLF